jgi:hypothetical protein
MQVLLDKMKHDPDFDAAEKASDPLLLMNVIEKTVLAQTEDQFPFSTVYEQENTLFAFHQGTLTNAQWYERFNTKVAVGKAIGITRQHRVLLEHVAKETHFDSFAKLSEGDQLVVREDTEERYISYIFLRQSGKQHNKLRTDLMDEYTTGTDQHPKTRQAVLHLLDKYTKSSMSQAPYHPESSFAQKGGKKQKKDAYDPDFYKDKTCFKCQKTGHIATHCKAGKGTKNKSSKDKDDDEKSTRSSKSSKSNKSKDLDKLKKDFKKQKKSFTTLATQLEDLENDSDLSGSDSDGEREQSFAQFGQSKMIDLACGNTGVSLSQKGKARTKPLNMRNVVLLDNQSTMDLFCNERLVYDITKALKPMLLQSNGGTMPIRYKASIKGYHRRVWFDKNAITNIICQKHLKKQYRITYDSALCDAVIVHRSNVNLPNMEFKMDESGLHFYNPFKDTKGMTFIQTVKENRKDFTTRQNTRADEAEALYPKLAGPTPAQLKWMLSSGQIIECPLTQEDVSNALAIHGKNSGNLQGKTTRQKTTHVEGNPMRVPPEFLKLHKFVYLTADIFFVHKQVFFITLSRKIDFTAVSHIKDRKISTIFKAFQAIYRYYLQRGFRITTVSADGEFAPLQALINEMPGGPRMNNPSANEHVPEIERRIRVVKERTRSIRCGLPFSRIPTLLMVNIVVYAAKMLTFFITKGGVSKTMSPRMIMTGEKLHYKKHLCLQLGEYCQVHEQDAPRNSMAARTQGAICMGPSGNQQGGFKFMSLRTGKKITRFVWTPIPMPDFAIARVNFLGRNQPKLIAFYDRRGREIGDIEPTGVDDEGSQAPQNQLEDTIEEEENDLDLLGNLDDNPGAEQPPPADEPEVELGMEEQNAVAEEVLVEPDAPAPEAQADVVQPQAQAEPEAIPGVRRGTRTRIQSKSYVPSMKGNKYSFAITQLEEHGALHPDFHMCFCEVAMEEQPDVVAAIMTQLSLKRGLKEWGAEAEEAVYSEMKQLHLRNTFRPMHPKDLTEEQRKCVLESHLFLKQKRDGTIKGRTVAGGNKQRDFISKEDASSPTVATEAVLLSCVIAAEEGRDVKVIDIPNAFIQTRVEDEKDMAVIKIRGVLVDMLVKIAPEVYGQYVKTDQKGVKYLITQCLNAIYGTMVASLLYYNKFVKTLKAKDFKLNPYSPCVANRMVNGKQQSILWHVDDCFISHLDEKVNDKFIDELREEYESIFEDGSGKMKVSKGKVVEYLGMTLDFSVPGQCSVTMIDYVKECIKTFDSYASDDRKKIKTSAAPSNLFVVNPDSKKLSKTRSEKFHSVVAKILFATKRARPDTGTSISYLCKKVRESDTDDWIKLEHLIDYLRGTKDLPLILRADGTGILKWYIDGSHGVHVNMRGHTGGGLTMGTGYPITTSTTQKINTKSSTETEIVGVDDLMPAVLWTRLFLEAQGYGVVENIIYQDNKSAILLEKNGKASSGKRTKHINMRYFFITDRISKKDMSVEWCPTEDMTSDFFTKPLQGALFLRFRDLIMGVTAQPPPRLSKPKKKITSKKTLGKKDGKRD